MNVEVRYRETAPEESRSVVVSNLRAVVLLFIVINLLLRLINAPPT